MKKRGLVIFLFLIGAAVLVSACAQIEYKIYFRVDGELYATVNTNGGETVKMPPDPQKDDAVFGGWFWDDGQWEEPVTVNSLLNAPLYENMTVYAKWITPDISNPDPDPIAYTVTFNGGGGVYVSGQITQTVPGGQAADAPVFAKNGLTLAWDRPFDTIIADTAVNAVWLAKADFEAGGGSLVESVTVVAGGRLTVPVCERAGYILDGWYLSETGGQTFAERWSWLNPVEADLTLYAKWTEVAEYGTDGLDYTLLDGGASYAVSVGSAGSAETVVIPSRHNGLPVVEISDKAFYTDGNLTAVTIPDTVTRIGEYAFYFCSSLETVSFGPDSLLRSIETHAFSTCKALANFAIPSGVKEIEMAAFANTALTSVTIPDGVTQIERIVFGACFFLETVSFGPDSLLQSIEAYAFSGCRALANFAIPSGVKEIGVRAFYGAALTSMAIPDGVETLVTELFSGCARLESVTFGANSRLRTIRRYAFLSCSALTSIVIPDGVTRIEPASFKDTGLAADPDGVVYAGSWVVGYGGNAPLLTVKQGTKGIADYAFRHTIQSQDYLTTVVLPASLERVGEYAFLLGTSDRILSAVYYEGAGQADWDKIVFEGGNNGLTDCPKRYYYSETAPAVAETYWRYVDGVPAVWDVADPLSLLKFTSIDDGAAYQVSAPHSAEVINVVIPAYYKGLPVVKIPDAGFATCLNLQTVWLPDTVKRVGNNAFMYCPNLTGVYMPRVEILGNNVFMDCDKLDEIYLPASLHTVGIFLFRGGNTKFPPRERPLTVYVGGSAKSTAGWAASWNYDCAGIVIAYDSNPFVSGSLSFMWDKPGEWVAGANVYGDAFETLVTAVIPAYHLGFPVTGVMPNGFAFCERLQTVILPETARVIDFGAFFGCANLTAVYMPNVERIEGYAFGACPKLEEIYLPACVRFVGAEAFWVSVYEGAWLDGRENPLTVYIAGSAESTAGWDPAWADSCEGMAVVWL
ncbi:MAG: leucine-rich repeat protein [Clostridiales bacterium]|jgi:uncharacterized repeat protein (TIGR02543 family)|nr:leucine-rich repeat protein [Clostridiales bacterium]